MLTYHHLWAGIEVLRKSPEFRILQMPSNPQLFYSNAVFGQIWVLSGFFELDTAIPDEQFDLLDYFLKISNSKTK